MIIDLMSKSDTYEYGFLFRKYFMYHKRIIDAEGVAPEQVPAVLKEQHGIEVIPGTMLVKVPDGWESFATLLLKERKL